MSNFINQLLPHNQFFDCFFSFFSIQGMSIAIWILIAALLIFFEEKNHPRISKKDKKIIFSLAASLTITAILVNFVLKPAFHRLRPPYLISNCPNDFSFPSSHAATAFAAATIIAFFDKKRKGFYYGVAFLISLSRIYLGCHYFFDVLIGAIIGYFISKLIVTKLSQKRF